MAASSFSCFRANSKPTTRENRFTSPKRDILRSKTLFFERNKLFLYTLGRGFPLYTSVALTPRHSLRIVRVSLSRPTPGDVATTTWTKNGGFRLILVVVTSRYPFLSATPTMRAEGRLAITGA